MRGDSDENEFDDDGYCPDCGGDGWILTCIDDICHGLGYCIHGDGDQMCSCNDGNGDRVAPVNAPADWKYKP